MTKRLYELTLTLLVAAANLSGSNLSAQDPFLGTWEMNRTLSKYRGSPEPRSATILFYQSQVWLLANTVHVDAAGVLVTSFFRFRPDGQDYPYYSNGSRATIVTAQRLRRNVMRMQLKRDDGTLISTIYMTLSPDERSLTRTSVLDPKDTTGDVIVYEKQTEPRVQPSGRDPRTSRLADAPSCVRGKGDQSISANLDAYVGSEMHRRGIPGLALAVVKHGQVVDKCAFGLANVELKAPLRAEAVFQIASITKIVTGAALMTLVDQGKLTLETELDSILPDLPEAWRKVTIRQCMSHTHGLPEVVTDPSTGGLIADQPAEALQRLMKLPPPAQPGERWVYGQTGYMLAQLAIEKVSGKPFSVFLKEQVSARAGMHHTSWGDFRLLVDGRVSYYARPGSTASELGNLTPFFQLRFPPVMESGAGLNSNLDDLIAFDRAIESGVLLRNSSAQAMWTDTPLTGGGTAHYGVGWTVFPDPEGRKLVGHTGANAATVVKDLDAGITVIVLTNLAGADSESIAMHVLDLAEAPN